MTTRSKRPAVIPRALLVLLLLVFARGILCTVSYDHVDVGFSTSAIRSVDVNGFFLHSVDDIFALGFSTFGGPEGEYYLSIIHLSTSVVVWTANRNSPVRQSDLLYFEPGSGNVTLKNTQGVGVWYSNTTGGSRLQLQGTGNLVVLDRLNRTLWQSFDHPTDTLLSGQKLVPGMRLTANKGSSDFSPGSYYMAMDDEDLLLWVAAEARPQAYWSMTKDDKTGLLNPGVSAAYALIDESTRSLVLCSEDGTIVSALILDAYNLPTLRRATLRPDGNLEVYYYSGSLWNSALLAVRDPCNLPQSCGAYGLCSNNGQCICPPKTDPVDSSDFSRGCIPRLSRTRCAAGNNQTQNNSSVGFVDVGNVDYYGNAFAEPNGRTFELDSCFQACLNDCLCTALFFQNETGRCFVWHGLGTMKAVRDANRLGFLKVNRSEISRGSGSEKSSSMESQTPVAVISVIAGGTAIVIGGLLVGAWYLHRRRVAKAARLAALAAEDDELMEIPGLPTRFTYKELEMATNAFANKLGSGGFGSVYEGALADNTRIAVKRLESVGQGKKEFWAEVATIGSIHHVHLVRLVGFCAEGASRLLVYEFMANGSLDKILFRKEDEKSAESIVLDWETRVNICLGTAQGLAYLHEDCRERIIHCDIKPENILLDERFSAKVSDFGLAKLMNREQSEVFTTMRGTRGYLAPEWLMNYAISDKSDVYSFGMVLLELISGRKNFDPAESSEKWYFPIYAYRVMEVGKLNLLADPRLNGLVDEDQVRLLTKVALWCIQDEVATRPSMKTVVMMLEGIVEVPNPPSSPQMAVRLHGRKYDTSGNDSKDSLFNSGDMSATPLSAPR